MRFLNYSLIVIYCFICIATGHAQANEANVDSVLTLDQCIGYALKNQPLVRESKLDEKINQKEINVSLSGWLPQVDLNAYLQHYLQLPVTFFPDVSNLSGPKIKTTTGLLNTSAALFSANQAIYSSELLFTGKAVRDLKLRATENTENSEISTVIQVSRAFYEVMLAVEQDGLWEEDIHRLERNSEDAQSLFQLGLTDKIDYQQSVIALNNARIQKRNSVETIKAKYQFLKQNMGYPPDNPLHIAYDSTSYVKNILADTLERLDYDKRIEYRQLQTEIQLQDIQTGYYRWSFLPSLSAYYDYNVVYQHNDISHVYGTGYPNSLAGLTLTLPIFHGTERLQNLAKSHLQHQRMNEGMEYLKSRISTEYVTAMANYKSNLNALKTTMENTKIAKEVYNIVTLQYSQGIKTYLDVIVAETDLRTSQLNYISTLFQVLTTKLDLDAAMGNITGYSP